MHAELEKQEEEGHHQCPHQEVLEEPRAGTCQTANNFLPDPARREAPRSSLFIPVLTNVIGFSPINWATARRLAWSESG